jgi:sugar phosphate isomerase/epimerase
VLQLKLAADLSAFGLPLRQALAAAAGLGIQAVEIDARRDLRPGELSETGLRQIRKLLDDYRLRVAAVRFRTRRGYSTQADLDARIEATKKAMSMAYALGAPIVVNQIGFIPEKSDSPDWQLLVEVLGDLGRHGQKAGALLAAETGDAAGSELKRLLDVLPDYALLVALNPGQLILNGFSVLDAIEAVGSAVTHVYANDAVSDRPRSLGRFVALGEGAADFPALLGALEERGYRGYLTLTTADESAPTAAMKQAMDFLKQL